jgi:osmotically-inducible protein OsmY
MALRMRSVKFCVLAFLMLVGCGADVGGARAAGMSGPTDAQTAADIRLKLLAAGGPSVASIGVEVRNGIAILSGTANTLLARRWTPALAKTVTGVRGIVDLVNLAPGRRSDGDIQADVQTSLASDPATAGWLTRVTAIGGTVTLGGTVSSRAARRLAGIAAMGVEGVQDVDNEIVVGRAVTRPPAEIQIDIEESLRWDPWLTRRPIAVHVTSGQVFLSGAVATSYERRCALDLAHVTGVARVIDRLRIDPSLAAHENLTPRPDDGGITATVEAAFRDDPRLASAAGRVHVSVAEDGIAFLNGTVPDYAARRAARRDARDAVGVKRVVDGIDVTLPAPLPDAAVRRSIETALRHNPYIALDDITVTVDHGRALLRGVVPSAHLVQRAAALAARVPGVTGVTNRLTVLRLRSGPATSQILPGLQLSLAQMSDASIRAAMTHGVVTLTGIVYSVSAAERAEALAYANGAAAVDDRLRVPPHAAPA